MAVDLVIVIGVIVLGFAGMIWWLNRRLAAATPAPLDANEVVQTVIAVAREQLDGQQRQITSELTANKDAITAMVKDLEDELDRRQQEIRSLEQDRNLKFGEITKAIEQHKQLTSDLQGSTTELNRILSNAQLRGGWGERAVEQIFASVGLVEKRHFLIQQTLGSSGVRPDFIVLLPDSKRLCIDAKFPLTNLQLMTKTEDQVERARCDQLFAKDVKDKVGEIVERGYISTADGTCDYAVMFVPSEAVFDYINRQHPEIVDQALAKKVIMASPYSLVAIVRTICEAYRNFYYETSMREIVEKVDIFLNDFRLFQQEFVKIGKHLTATQDDFEQITGTRYRMLNRHIEQILAARDGAEQLGTVAGDDGHAPELELTVPLSATGTASP